MHATFNGLRKEYKSGKLNGFIFFSLQKALRNMNKFADDGKWLEENLEELLSDSPEADAAEERRRLQELLAKFTSLQPNMEKVSDKSAVFSKAYDFRDEIDKRSNWLDEAQRLVNDDPFIDGLEDARAYLLEHEVGRNVVIV